MQDFLDSLENALFRGGWVFDDKWSRIGNPFIWVDGSKMADQTFLKSEYAVLQCLSMYYELYPFHEQLRVGRYEDSYQYIKDKLHAMVSHFFSCITKNDRINNNIDCTAISRAQDFSFIDNFLSDVPVNPIHLDIGPGLGTHAIYSQQFLNSTYIALEANEYMYAVQRLTYRFLSNEKQQYYDVVASEKIGNDLVSIRKHLSFVSKYFCIHLPSWHVDMLEESMVDLITATFVLNEVTPAGIIWLLCHANRVLKNGGYFYIRDSHKLKPNRHSLNYDQVLKDLGFTLVKKLDVVNRIDMFGIPRAYQKQKHNNFTFEEMFDKYFGKFAITNHGGEYMQNVINKNN